MTKHLWFALLVLLPFAVYSQRPRQHTTNLTVPDTASKTQAAKPKPAPPKGAAIAIPAAAKPGNQLALTKNDSLAMTILKDFLEFSHAWQTLQSSGKGAGAETDTQKPKEVVYGYILFRDPCDIETFDNAGNGIRNPNYNGDMAAKESLDVKYDFIHIDSVLVKTTNTQISRVVIFAEDRAYTVAINMSPPDVNNFATLISFYRTSRSANAYVRLADILEYVPMEDTGNYTPINESLTPAAPKVNLIKQ